MATTYYITPGPNQDITGRVLTYDMQTPADASTINIVTTQYHTVVELASLTGNTTITATVGTQADGDELKILIPSDLTSPASTFTVTFSTGFKMPSNTLSMTGAKHGMATFTYFQGYWVGSTVLSAS